MNEHVDYEQFLERLSELISDGTTGTVRLITADHHFVSVGLESGEIIALRHGPKQGARALALIAANLHEGELTLSAAREMRGQGDLPGTQDILDKLRFAAARRIGAETQDLAPSRRSAPAATMAGPAFPSAAPARKGASIPPPPPTDLLEALDALRKSFQSYVGPIAQIVFDQTVADMGGTNSVEDVLSLAKHLAVEIDDPADARRFLSDMPQLQEQTWATTPITDPAEISLALERVRTSFLQVVGPVANVVFAQALDSLGPIETREALVQLAESLSLEVDDPSEAEHFLAQALQRSPR